MILHCDLDAFYASVEQILNPELKGKPVVVGGDPGRRGVVAAASYEARRFGVHSAMPLSQARRLCPKAIFVPANFAAYGDYSEQVFAVYHARTPLVEPLSLDEAFLDLAGTERTLGNARKVAEDIKAEVRAKTKLAVSIGIGTSKVVAKIASDLKKPDGLVEVPVGEEAAFLAPLPIRRMRVGPIDRGTVETTRPATVGDIAALPIEELVHRLGKHGLQLWEFAHGIDTRPSRRQATPRASAAKQPLTSMWTMFSVWRLSFTNYWSTPPVACANTACTAVRSI